MASSSAVRPLGTVYTICPCTCSTDLVKSASSSGLSAKVTMKNSSCGLAVFKNSTTASRDFSILLVMLPLMSKITPSETGASSLEKCLMFCGTLPSKTAKFSFSRPVTSRFMGSVMVTFTSTRSTSTWMGLVWVLSEGSPGTPGGGVVGFGRGVMWTSCSAPWAQRAAFRKSVAARQGRMRNGRRRPPPGWGLAKSLSRLPAGTIEASDSADGTTAGTPRVPAGLLQSRGSVFFMAEISPFRALRYDPAAAPLAELVTQPYDKLPPEMQERYYAASPYNLVRLPWVASRRPKRSRASW